MKKPRVMIMIACLAYLCPALMGISLGLRNILQVIDTRLASAEHDLYTELYLSSSSISQEQMLYSQFDNLLTSQLHRAPMESYEECLARGLETANERLLGYGFGCAGIRNQTMDWTMENCGRLLFTPQVKDETLQQVVLTYWARTSYHGRRIAEEALRFVKQKAYWIWGWVFSTDLVRNGSILLEHIPAYNQTPTLLNDHRIRTKMPFGFDLNCEDNKPCRLVYLSTFEKPINRPTASAETIAKKGSKVVQLLTFKANCAAVLQVVDWSKFILLLAQGLLISGSGAACIFMPEHRFLAEAFGSLSWAAKDLICLLAMELYSLGYPLAKNYFHPWNSNTVTEGLCWLMLGHSVLIGFFFSTWIAKEPFTFCGLVKELWSTVLGGDIPDTVDNQNTEQVPHAQADMQNHPTEINKQDALNEVARAASPTMTVQEDKFKADESDTTTDSEDEDENFVDLAGGVTPTVTEVEADWSVVDA